jgi:hypothetical protein
LPKLGKEEEMDFPDPSRNAYRPQQRR